MFWIIEKNQYKNQTSTTLQSDSLSQSDSHHERSRRVFCFMDLINFEKLRNNVY